MADARWPRPRIPDAGRRTPDPVTRELARSGVILPGMHVDERRLHDPVPDLPAGPAGPASRGRPPAAGDTGVRPDLAPAPALAREAAGRAGLAPAPALAREADGQAGLAARLARFRALDRALSPLPSAPGPRIPARAPDLATGLATALDAEVDRGRLGRVVRVHASISLPASLERLATLPYPVDPRYPLVCLDTETTGLGTAAGTVVFLVGLGRWDGERFEIEQLLLPDHPDEPAFLSALSGSIPRDAWLVTYNGRGFDWPLLVTRFRLQGAPAPPHAGHLDLLPVARQLWRHRLDDARLSTVERAIAGVHRHDDLPGALIPGRYLDFLRTGRADSLRAVVEHNRQDVVSLGLLLARLAERFADPGARDREHPGDVAALGRAYARHRRFDEALACCDTAVATAVDPGLRERLAVERARVLRLSGRHAESAATWRLIAESGGPLSAIAWVQLAKHLEHIRRDPAAALEAAERATALVERHRLTGRALPRLEHDLARRRARLRHRLARRAAASAPITAPASPGSVLGQAPETSRSRR